MMSEKSERITQLEAEVDRWMAEANRLYGVGQDIEADRVALQQQVETLREAFDNRGEEVLANYFIGEDLEFRDTLIQIIQELPLHQWITLIKQRPIVTETGGK